MALLQETPLAEASASQDSQPGRMCPRDYLTDPAALARVPDLAADTLYVIGGLYGNAFALGAVEALAAAEPAPTTLVFNGDAHWFDAEPEMFHELDARLVRYPAIAGNVELEIARDADIGAGCGCAYPPDVGDGVVERSNAILARLKSVAGAHRHIPPRLKSLPASLVARVGGLRIGIVHGDPTAIAGWGFAQERLDDRHRRPGSAGSSRHLRSTSSPRRTPAVPSCATSRYRPGASSSPTMAQRAWAILPATGGASSRA